MARLFFSMPRLPSLPRFVDVACLNSAGGSDLYFACSVHSNGWYYHLITPAVWYVCVIETTERAKE